MDSAGPVGSVIVLVSIFFGGRGVFRGERCLEGGRGGWREGCRWFVCSFVEKYESK